MKLGFRISHMGAAKHLRRNQLAPAPRRGHGSWRAFVRQHAAQILATDFFMVKTAWLKTVYVLFFIELKTRMVHLGGITVHPTGEWVVQQARNLAWKLQDGPCTRSFLLRDRDAKYTARFDQVFRSENVDIIQLPFRAPRANAIAERPVGTARRELLDHVLIFSCDHLESILEEFLDHYHLARPHQGLAQRWTAADASVQPVIKGRIVRHERLGGLLHEYSWAA